ncbi:hypothetical protein JCM1841_006403 [Sporobolomyces salmonicolor]
MEEPPLLFVERWTAELRALQTIVESPDVSVAQTTATAQTLARQLTERAGEVPAYELGRCERELRSVLDSINTAKSNTAPKSKFSFKRSAPASAASTPAPPPTVPAPASALSPAPPEPTTAQPPPTSLTLTSRSSVYLSFSDLPSSTAAPSATPTTTSGTEALVLRNLQHCLVDLLPPPPSPAESAASTFSALYLSELSDCTVLLPIMGGSVMVHGCERCVLVLGGHQFRMHDSTHCKVFLDAGSTPIVERCRELVFAGYPGVFSPFGATPAKQPFVQDFDFPFATDDSPSPNWRCATGEETARWAADDRWRLARGRRELWRERGRAGAE